MWVITGVLLVLVVAAAVLALVVREGERDGAGTLPAPVGTAVIPGPSWMDPIVWTMRVEAYRRDGLDDERITKTAAFLERSGPTRARMQPQGHKTLRRAGGRMTGSGISGMVHREDFVPKESEARYITRDAAGLPTLRLVDAVDRLAIWSPVDGGALINPRGPGLRSLGLYASYARGAGYHASAYRTADLRQGKWIDLKREPNNPHDKNAVAMHAPGAHSAFAYVQRGRASAVARRIDAGEEMAGVSMRGPGRGRDDEIAFVLIGSRDDLVAMLEL